MPCEPPIYHETAQILGLFGRNPPEPRISIAPSATVASLLLLLACFALFFSAANLLRNRARRRLFALAFFTAALLQTAITTLGIGERLAGAMWGRGRVVGYLEIALALAFGALWAEILTNRDRAASGTTDTAERFETRSLPLVGRFLLWGSSPSGSCRQDRESEPSRRRPRRYPCCRRLFPPPSRVPPAPDGGGLARAARVVLFSATLAGARPLVHFLESDPGGLNTGSRVALWRTAYRAWQDFRSSDQASARSPRPSAVSSLGSSAGASSRPDPTPRRSS